MAIKASVPTATGKATYWRVEDLNVNFGVKRAVVRLLGYENKTSAKKNAALTSTDIVVQAEDFDKFFDRTRNPYIDGYKAAMELNPQFEKAKED